MANRIRTFQRDMASLDFAPHSFDLIWCEGAAYIMGVEAGLLSWKSLLRHGGALALTEPVWLKPGVPAELKARAEYPTMGDAEHLRAIARRCGYAIAGDFILPEEAWWTGYYTPMTQQIEALSKQFAGDVLALSILDEARLEIDIYRRYSAFYGYMFIVLKQLT